MPELEPRLPCFDFDHGSPSWLAAVEAVVDAWLAAGELDGAEAALVRMRASLDRTPADAPRRLSTEAILRARLLARRGAVDDASLRRVRRATSRLRGGARRRRGCSASSQATSSRLREAERLEAALGVTASPLLVVGSSP